MIKIQDWSCIFELNQPIRAVISPYIKVDISAFLCITIFKNVFLCRGP